MAKEKIKEASQTLEKNKNKICYGALTIFYKIMNGQKYYLVVKNTKTGNLTFVGGAKEEWDDNLITTAQREILEELGLNKNQYKLISTTVKHEFIYGPNKKERAGLKGSNQVYLADLSDIKEINYTKDLKSVEWMTKEQVLNSLTFKDLKDVFNKAIN